jgi:hypothetical protein
MNDNFTLFLSHLCLSIIYSSYLGWRLRASQRLSESRLLSPPRMRRVILRCPETSSQFTSYLLRIRTADLQKVPATVDLSYRALKCHSRPTLLKVIANLKRVAEGFACSTGLRLVPVRNTASLLSLGTTSDRDPRFSQGLAPNQWGWVIAPTTPLQQDHIFFGAAPQTERVRAPLPIVTTPALFIGPATSMHPTSSCAAPWLDPYSTSPYGAGNAPSAFSRISLGGARGFSAVSPSAPSTIPPPMIPTLYVFPSDTHGRAI